jgi:hypothetical protein
VRTFYWIQADQDELEVLLHEFVGIYWRHRDRCEHCSSGPWCDGLLEIWELIEEWKRRRELRNRAAWRQIDRDLLNSAQIRAANRKEAAS